eukprot:469556-Amorphochlora_amoeboformis.AAC.1
MLTWSGDIYTSGSPAVSKNTLLTSVRCPLSSTLDESLVSLRVDRFNRVLESGLKRLWGGPRLSEETSWATEVGNRVGSIGGGWFG